MQGCAPYFKCTSESQIIFLIIIGSLHLSSINTHTFLRLILHTDVAFQHCLERWGNVRKWYEIRERQERDLDCCLPLYDEGVLKSCVASSAIKRLSRVFRLNFSPCVKSIALQNLMKLTSHVRKKDILGVSQFRLQVYINSACILSSRIWKKLFSAEYDTVKRLESGSR